MRRPAILIMCLFYTSFAYCKENIDLNITGLKGELFQNAKNLIADEKNKNNCFALRNNINAYIACAAAKIHQSLEPFGYFKPTIEVSKKYDALAKRWNILIHVLKGRPLLVTSIDIKILGEGYNNDQLVKFKKSFPIKINDRFIAMNYTTSKIDFFKIANNEGYINAYFERNNVIIDLHSYKAKIILYLQTGKRYYFGKTIFSTSQYSQEFLNRFINYKQGEPLSNKIIMNLQESMSDSVNFKVVNVTPMMTQADHNQIPIKIDVVPPKPQKYSAALGYGTFTGPRLTLDADFRYLTSTGHHAQVKLRDSSILTGLSSKYYIPGKKPTEDKWLIGADYQRFFPKNGKSFSNTIYFGYIKKAGRYFENISLNYLTERYKTVNEPYLKRKLVYPSFNISYREADNLIIPKNGKSISLTVRGASKSFLSSTKFAQSDLLGKLLFNPTSFSNVILKGEFGYTVVENTNNLPLTMRYFAGGLGSIRGYPDGSIGPGRYLELGSIEYQNKLIGNWWGAVFYDVGTATNHFGQPLNVGIGAGVIYESFVGPIRFYLAKAITKRDKPYAIDFSIGPAF